MIPNCDHVAGPANRAGPAIAHLQRSRSARGTSKRLRDNPPRGGFLLLTALVCVALAVALAGLLARMAMVDMQYDRSQLHRMQCEWLVEAGVERAAARLAADPDYTGETWRLGPEQLDGRHAAVVRIAVAPDAERPAETVLNVQADFPDNPHRRVRQTRAVRLPPNNTSFEEEEP